jgi:fumarate hydratase class II
LASAIVQAAAELREGRFDDHFPLTVWQTGSGTQTNMNVNEVVANRANEIIAHGSGTPSKSTASVLGSKHPVHPNDHVNRSQSSNDSFPTAMHIVTLLELRDTLIPSLLLLERTLQSKAIEFQHLVKIGRTHLMDAVPMTMGQSFDAFARQIGHHIDRVRGTVNLLRELPQGGTAVGSGVNAPAGFDWLFCEELNAALNAAQHRENKGDGNGRLVGEKIDFIPAASKFESMGCHDALVDVSGVLNGLATSLLKMATDLRFLGSGPRCGFGELVIPHDGLTSSIMPGKRNPTLAEVMSQIAFQVMGNHSTISVAGAAGGNFELNVAKPVIIYNVLQSITLLAEGVPTFTKGLIDGLKPDERTLKRNVESSLLQATALNPLIGYDAVSKIVKLAMDEDLRPREAALRLGLVTGEQYDKATDPAKMISLPPRTGE